MSMDSTCTHATPEDKPGAEVCALPPSERTRVAARCVEAVLLAIAAIFFVLHYVHLRADFPNHSPWMDWSKYTDEGWYGDAAIRHYLLGHWNVPGDFNPAAALPVWPAIESVLFRVTGVSLVAARALTVSVFGLILVCCYTLIRRWSTIASGSVYARQSRALAPALAVSLLAISPFCFVLMRLAILEPLLILLMLASLLAATSAGSAARDSSPGVGRAVALGLLLPLMVLTKTTAVFLFPAIFWLLWAACGSRLGQFLRVASLSGGVAAVGWGSYFLLVVRPHYLVDYRYLFSANTYTGVKWNTLWSVLGDTVIDGFWIGKTLFMLAILAVLGSLLGLCYRKGRTNPLSIALLLWIFGYASFLAYHDNLQPRYYLVLAVPLTMLVAMAFDEVLVFEARTRLRLTSDKAKAPTTAFDLFLLRTATTGLASAGLLFVAVHGAWMTTGYLLHPEYTWVSAAAQIRAAVDREVAAHPEHSRLILSISGSDLTLMTGLPSICDDFGTMELADRVTAYKPGWFATWNDVEDDKMDALSPAYRLERVLAIPAFDDPDRNLLILYRLDLAGAPVRVHRHPVSARHMLRTKQGIKSAEAQLQH
jgi:hypothetical protein